MAGNEFSMTRVQRRPKQERKLSNMKNRNIQLTAMLFVVALAIAPILQAETSPEENGPTATIYSTGNIARGQTGAFVLNLRSAGLIPPASLGGMYVKFSVGGTAIPGVDYVALVSPVRVGESGYAVLLIKALRDPRGSSINQRYSVVVKLDDSPGYKLGSPSTATMWIGPLPSSN